jgi:hypothetical protein
LQMALGHSTMDMVRRYLALAQADMEAAHRLASPVANWGLYTLGLNHRRVDRAQPRCQIVSLPSQWPDRPVVEPRPINPEECWMRRPL